MAEKEYTVQEIKAEFDNYHETEKYISLNYIHTVYGELADYCDNRNKYLTGDIIRYLFLKIARKAADVVEVVRCKDCVHKVNFKGRVMCNRNAKMMFNKWCGLSATDNDHFCSYGERKDNE